jgi:hypothetical protein
MDWTDNIDEENDQDILTNFGKDNLQMQDTGNSWTSFNLTNG